MQPRPRVRMLACHLGTLLSIWATSAVAASPTAEQALRLVPIQREVEFDRPDAQEVSRCSISARKIGGHVGWIVEDSRGTTLRRFVDTNDDNIVDQWSYYKGGLEVYRDIDSDFNGKPDQYRWFHTGGSRWGVDKDGDGKIDAWKSISAEEVTAEVIAALGTRDVERFGRLTLTSPELATLGLGAEEAEKLSKQIGGLRTAFEQLVAQQKDVTSSTRWIQFSGGQPGIVPAGTNGSTKDLRVYENVVAIAQTGQQHGQVFIGTLIEVGDVWRVIHVPQPISDEDPQLAASGFFFQGPTADRVQLPSSGTSEAAQTLLAELEKLDAAAGQATSVEEQARYNAKRADLLEQIAGQTTRPEDRAMWIRQLAEMVSAAVQSGSYPDGVKRLESLFEKLQRNDSDRQLAAYVRFRQLMAEYSLKIQNASAAGFVQIQEQWVNEMEQYTADYLDSPDAAEAMLQLAIAREFAGEEDEAVTWYGRIVQQFPNSPAAEKAVGARRRLESVGRTILLHGTSPGGETVDLANYRGKVVLIQYWATWCEPCKTDMAALKELLAKYGPSGFSIIGVNLDSTVQEMTSYLAENRLPWPQIYEEGGLDSRPANEMGILTLPTMILIDQMGKVVRRNIQVSEIDGQLRRLIP